MGGRLDPEVLCAAGRRVIAAEADALGKLAASLGRDFAMAAELILEATGRVIVSGMGKSGHVARKVASTLASTGTPAHFVHPAEASHGDLGMLTGGDVVLLLSNSGETPELADMITYTRRFSIPLIGVAGQAGSTLLSSADVAILLPKAPEACLTVEAPTSSTAMTLALGDALAVALMEHRSFTPQMFREFHPGGRLGAQLARVRDLMHGPRDLPLVKAGTVMSEALLTMTERGFGVVGVKDDADMLVGVVTDGDLRRHMDGLLDRRVEEVMTTKPRTIGPDSLAAEALGQMTTQAPKVTCLFVVDPEEARRPIGVLHIHDCLRAGLG